jgi:hypothetical protein
MGLKYAQCKNVSWIHVAYDMVQWDGLVNTDTVFWVPEILVISEPRIDGETPSIVTTNASHLTAKLQKITQVTSQFLAQFYGDSLWVGQLRNRRSTAGRDKTTHLRLLISSRMRGGMAPLPDMT